MSTFPFLQVDDFSRSNELLRNLPLRFTIPIEELDPFDEPSPRDPIFEAIEQNDKEKLTRLLRKRKRDSYIVPIDIRNWTPFHLAASRPLYTECLGILIQCHTFILPLCREKLTLYSHETALHIACYNGCDENTLLLLRKGWDPEKKTASGCTALHLAASKGFLEVVQHLLDFKADINAKNGAKRTPLHLAARATCSDSLDTTGILLEKGADILSVDEDGNLPLHLACKQGTFETACLLLERNSASLNTKNSAGVTPFMFACKNFNAHGVQYLLQKGGKMDVCDKRGRVALHFIKSHVESFTLLLQSIDVNDLEQCCVSSILNILDKDTRRPYKFEGYTCSTIHKGADCLKVLMNSDFPKSMLQMPSVQCGTTLGTLHRIAVYSPLAYLFLCFAKNNTMAFDECLDSLLKHQLVMIDEFQRVAQPKWPTSAAQFLHPLAVLLSSAWPNDNREHYFNLLKANNVTTDYCLQCFHDNDKPFATFYDYQVHYCLVVFAVEKFNVEVVKLLLLNSVILEPDVLCNYLIMAYTKKRNLSAKDKEDAHNLYQYLISLKPVYHKWVQQYDPEDVHRCPFLPAAKKISYETVANFLRGPYKFQRSPIFASSDQTQAIPNNYQPFPFVSMNEEFADVTLQQLCRTAIRQQLREPTLDGNLRNFQRNILELPLPNLLKDYLLFKN